MSVVRLLFSIIFAFLLSSQIFRFNQRLYYVNIFNNFRNFNSICKQCNFGITIYILSHGNSLKRGIFIYAETYFWSIITCEKATNKFMSDLTLMYQIRKMKYITGYFSKIYCGKIHANLKKHIQSLSHRFCIFE